VLYQGVDVLICEAHLPPRHGALRAQSGPSAALLDDFENVVIRQLLHLIAIGKISRLSGENVPNWAIAAAGLSVTGGAIGVENLSGWIMIRSTIPAKADMRITRVFTLIRLCLLVFRLRHVPFRK